MVYAISGLGSIAFATAMVQGAVPSALGTGEMILMGFQVIILGAVGITYAQGRTGERRDAEGRKALHERIDRMVSEQNNRDMGMAEKYGRLVERSDTAREDLIGVGLRIEAIGSKITNNVERALESRQSDTDRRFNEILGRLRDVEKP